MSQFESIDFSKSEHGQCLHSLVLDQQYKQLLLQSVLNDLHELGWTEHLAPIEYSMFFSLIYDYFSMTNQYHSLFVGSPGMQTIGILWEQHGNHTFYLFFTLIHYLITRFHQKLSLQHLSLPSNHSHSQKFTNTTNISWLTKFQQCIENPISSLFSSINSSNKLSPMSFVSSLSMNSLLSQLISHPKQTLSNISQEYIQQNQKTLLHICQTYLFLEQTLQLLYSLIYVSNQCVLTQGRPSLTLFLTGFQMKSTMISSSCINSTQLQSQYSQLYWKLLTDVIYAIKTTIHEPTIKYYIYFYISKYFQYIKPFQQQIIQILSNYQFFTQNKSNSNKEFEHKPCNSSCNEKINKKIDPINTSIQQQRQVVCCLCHQNPAYQPVQSICCQNIYCYLCFYQLISSTNETSMIDFTEESDYFDNCHNCHTCHQTLDLKSIQPLILSP